MPRNRIPPPPGPGRPKGCKNKMTVAVKEALEEAFERRGGVDALVTWANKSQDAFYALWGKLLPKDMTLSGKDGSPIIIRVVTGVLPPETPKPPADAGI